MLGELNIEEWSRKRGQEKTWWPGVLLLTALNRYVVYDEICLN